jgi:integrase
VPVDDLWFTKQRGPDGKFIPSKRHGRGKRYRARWVGEDGRADTKMFDRKEDAKAHEANQRADVHRGVYIDARRGKVTVREYAEQHRAEQILRDSTVARMERAFRLHVYPLLGDLQIGAVRQAHIRNWVKDRSAELKPSTLRLIFANLNTVFLAAVADKVRADNPCAGVRLPEIDNDEMLIPTPDQVHALAAALPLRYRAVAYVVAGTGLRPGEVLGLELEHAAFLAREVKVVQQLITLTGRVPFLAPVKTKTSKRTGEMPEIVSVALAEHIRLFPPQPVEVDDETNPRRPVRRPALLLFPNEDGRPVHRSNWSRIWAPAARSIGLPKGTGLHVLRHYFASLLIENGASVKTVQMALGHSTPTITLNTYVHLWPDVVDRTRSLVDAALGKVPAASSRKAG